MVVADARLVAGRAPAGSIRRRRPTRVIACRPSYTAWVEIVPSDSRTRVAIVSGVRMARQLAHGAQHRDAGRRRPQPVIAELIGDLLNGAFHGKSLPRHRSPLRNASDRPAAAGAPPNCRRDCQQRPRIATSVPDPRESPMSARTTPPFRADHVGSLLRPPRCSRPARGTPPASVDRRRAARRRGRARSATSSRLQEDVGLQSATDGEFRRTSWHMDFIYQLGGVTHGEERLQVHFRNARGRARLRVGGAAGRTTGRAARHDLRRRLRVPAATRSTHRDAQAHDPVAEHGPLPRRPRRDRRGRLPRARRVLGRPAAAYAERGAPARRARLHLPAARRHQPGLPQRPEAARRWSPSRAATPSTSTSATSAHINAALAGPAGGLHVTTHMCRGNFRSSWAAEGGYDFVAEALFSSSTSTASSWSTTTSAPAASSRCASCRRASRSCSAWSPPSAASSRTRTTLKRRIDEAAQYVPLDQLCLSPQCGFSSTRRGQRPHRRRAVSPSSAGRRDGRARSGASDRRRRARGRPPDPVDRARELVRGGFDPHVHIAPDFVPRRITDVELARRFAELGLAGFGLKSHYTATAERAAVVNAAVPGVRALGTITLNRAVGGLNPLAVEIAARQGARIVWLPTVELENEQHEVARRRPGRQGAGLGALRARAARGGRGAAAGAGRRRRRARCCPSCSRCSRVVARHDLVLAHRPPRRATRSSRSSTRRSTAGVETIVVTHPEFPSQRISARATRSRSPSAARCMERAFTTPYTGKCTWEELFAATRAVGAARTVWCTDLGQVFNPPVEDGLAIMADRFLAAGFSDEEVRTMAVENTRRLARAATVPRRRAGHRRALGRLRLARRRRGRQGRRGRRRGRGDRALLRRARRVRRAVEGGGPDGRERQARPPRRGRGGRGGTSARSFRCLDLGDYPLQIDGDALLEIADVDPRVRARRPDHPHRHRPVQPRPPGRPRRGRPRARRSPPAPASRARSPRSRRRSCSCSSPTSPSCATSRRRVHVDITVGVGAEGRGDGRDEGAAVPADLLRPARRAARQPRAPRVRATRTCATASRSSACSRRWWSEL